MKTLRTRLRTITFLTAVTLILSSCSKYKGTPDTKPGTIPHTEQEGKKTEARQEIKQTKKDEAPTAPRREIIYTGTMTIRVSNAHDSRNKILNDVSALGGYLSAENSHHYSGRFNITLTIRIPKEKFYPLIDKIGPIADHMVEKTITSQDVTEQFVDTEARLKHRRQVAERYSELLKKANTIHEVLDVQNRLSSTQEEIEAAEGRLRYLRSQVDYSTLTLNIYHTEAVTSSDYSESFFYRIGRAITTGWNLITGFIIGLTTLWPFLFLAGVGFWVFRRYRKKHNTTKQ